MPANRLSHSEEERQFYAQEYEHVQGVDSVGVGSRIYGARIAAGFVYDRDAAEANGLDRSEYSPIERDLRPVEQHIVDHAVANYGVTAEYLMKGKAGSQTEIAAARLTVVQQRYYDHWNLTHDIDGNDDDCKAYDISYAAVLERLRAILEATGHASINAAAGAHGWTRSLFWDHVTGARFLHAGVLTGYCLAMGARPEFGLLGEGPMRETELVEWSERKLGSHAHPSP